MAKKRTTSTNYPVGDFLIRIKNAAMADQKEVAVRKTKLIKAVAEALMRAGILREVEENDDELTVKLAYHAKKPVVLDIRLVSKPGLRTYINADELDARRSAFLLIISTPKGILSSKEAIKERVGGEVIAEIY